MKGSIERTEEGSVLNIKTRYWLKDDSDFEPILKDLKRKKFDEKNESRANFG